MQKLDIRYQDPEMEQENVVLGMDSVAQAKPKQYIVDKIARHLIFGAEFMMGNSLRLRAGYNHMRRMELSARPARGMAGFSLGLGIRVRKYRIDYGLASFNHAGASHVFTISTNLDRYFQGKGGNNLMDIPQ